jgi:hypothetical protein
MTPAGIEPATFRFVAQNLNHCVTAVPIQVIALSILLQDLILYVLVLQSVPLSEAAIKLNTPKFKLF